MVKHGVEVKHLSFWAIQKRFEIYILQWIGKENVVFYAGSRVQGTNVVHASKDAK